MKQIDKFVLKSFIPPYIMAFFVAEFVLLMQFLWKYIDDILGKGFSFGVLIELIFYFGVTIIPMAIPISILISSVMVFGNMAERFELSAYKSAGVSLMRIMAAGILIAILTGLFSLFASNYLKPKANYKFLERFNSVRRQKPSLTIEESVYNKDFAGYAIWVSEKEEDDISINDVMIYDHTESDRSRVNFVKAKTGEMYSDQESGAFIMQLYDGEQYREIKKSKKKDDNSHPFMRTKFKSWKKTFDLSQFEMNASGLNLTRKKYDLLNSFQLKDAIDTLEHKRIKEMNRRLISYDKMISNAAFEAIGLDATNDNLKIHTDYEDEDRTHYRVNYVKQSFGLDSVASFFETFDEVSKSKVLSGAAQSTRDKMQRVSKAVTTDDNLYREWTYHQLRLHQQFSWALICVIFLFIGGPFGSIVRKGGYGYPLLIAIVFFVLFIIINIAGEKMNKSLAIHPILAAWLPCIVLFPFAIFFTWKALNDRSLNLGLPGFLTRFFKSDSD